MVSKIFRILGVVGRVFLILFMIGFIAGVGYTFYYYNMPMDQPRPVDLETVFRRISTYVRLPAHAAPGPAVIPTQSITPPAEIGTPAPS